ncbi:MAG: glycoside hydrolase family 65 protein [Candidatus Omnitrophica bacterium]|nr:glycoside hydrolase family 65 protein [Candidatus Omnitrophota bacterium]
MNSRFSKYLSKEEWLIREKGWVPDELGIRETQFTIGNGYLGLRGIYEEIPDGTEPGTYIAGVYDSAASMVPELVNAPNPIDFRIAVEGEKLDIGRMVILENERSLDMKRGLLTRRTIFSDTKNRRFLYESIRFFSLYDKHIGGMQICLKSLDKSARIIVQDTVDDSVTNIGGILEGRKRHTQLVEVSPFSDMNYMCVKTFTKKIWIAYGTFLAIARGRSKSIGTLNKIFNMTLGKGESACFTKLFSIYTSKHISYRMLKNTSIGELRRAKKIGFEDLLKRHIGACERAWRRADVEIDGDHEAQKALRFNIYHLLIAGNETNDDVSISARTLSGNGYRGHIFWDTELFMLPFFIYTNPKIARNLLMYRFNRMAEARKIAESHDFEGVLFPWESADTGAETTPPYAKNLDGSIVEIHTMDMEHHIVADVAYGVSHYFTATSDTDFMLRAGLEIMFETARFWASRITYNKETEEFHINRVIGPDEFHENVNNNAYVNRMARWNIHEAIRFYEYFGKKYPRPMAKISKKILLKSGEVNKWKRVSDRIRVPFSKSKGIIEEFDGYLKKRDIILKHFNRYFMPVLPPGVSIDDFNKTQLVKQADVVMLLYLFGEEFTKRDKIRNYLYYAKRTLHKSSLSPSIYSIIASELGDTTRAYLFFLFSLYADLKNTHGNCREGIHAASLGGTWQAAIMGFSGFRVIGGIPSFYPRLPQVWKSMRYNIRWRNCELQLEIGKDKIGIMAFSGKKGRISVRIFDSVREIAFNKKYLFAKN